MTWSAWLTSAFGLLAGGAVTALAVVLVRFNLKRLHIARAAARATSEQLEQIYRTVEACGTEDCQGFVLAWTNETLDDSSCEVTIPAHLTDFPWAGRSIGVRVERDVQFHFLGGAGQGIRLLGRKYRPVAVPRIRLKSGKARNQFDPKRYLKGNPLLRETLWTVCPRYPDDLLSYLLCAATASFEFEPINQGRIGTSAAWVQDPEHQQCDQCRKRMTLIIQLPGTLLHKKEFQRGTFYFFGCKSHPDRTATVAQFT
jgi:hypothetical protein